ncbi:BRCC3 [Blepharisma stoltei]|uniref:MPN domain-containing protein n=1 Tax=Blepharisma stoltei TaxID=1481888 RepID=A0AAU9K2U6_9CILI|nr:unnamed protein product [Blepharisma stoltei]
MSVEKVELSSDCFRGLLGHSFITSQEEVLGILFGDYDEGVVRIWGSKSLQRNCKEKDRVEVDDIQLSEAMDHAEELSRSIQQASTVKGWFHSHPNITVFPSHVDIRTQHALQSLGREFVGLIISCFSRDQHNLEKIDLIAFQTINNKAKSIQVEIVSPLKLLKQPELMIMHDCFDYLLEVQRNILREEQQAYESTKRNVNALGAVYNASLFNLSISRLLQKSLLPLYEYIKQKHSMDKERLDRIIQENKEIEAKLAARAAKEKST